MKKTCDTREMITRLFYSQEVSYLFWDGKNETTRSEKMVVFETTPLNAEKIENFVIKHLPEGATLLKCEANKPCKKIIFGITKDAFIEHSKNCGEEIINNENN